MNYNQIKNNKIFHFFLVIGVYLIFIVVFSFLYQCAYTENVRHFTFNNEIRAIRKTIKSEYVNSEDVKKIVSNYRHEMSQLDSSAKLLKSLLDDKLNLVPIVDKDNTKSTISMSGYKYTIVNRYLPGTIYLTVKDPPESHFFLKIEKNNLLITNISIPDQTMRFLEIFRHSNDKNIHVLSMIPISAISVPKDFKEFQKIIHAVSEQLDDDISLISSNIDRLTSTEPWSYWDFLYFSTITQTTVGYGDMLPNTTYVRMLVIAQVLIGVILIAL